MKKIYLGLGFISYFVLIFNGTVLGELSGDNQNTINSGMDISVDHGGVPNNSALQANKLNYIDVRFCNDGVEEEKLTDILSIIAEPEQEKEICIIIFNRDNEDVYLWGGFATNDIGLNGNNNCGTDYGWDNPFSKFIKPFEEKSITVPAKGSTVKKTTIKFPIGVNGLQKGCFAFGTTPGKLAEGEMFAFVTRKIQLINVLVAGDSNIENKIKISKITSEIDENKKLGIELNIENGGSTDESIDINGEISNIFGYKQTFIISGVVGINKSKIFNTKDFGEEIELPRYKGPFTIKLEINYRPYFDFDVSKYGFDLNKLVGSTITETKSVFFFPTIPAIGLLVFLLLIYLAFFKKPRVIIQQVPTPTTTPIPTSIPPQ